jgi:hypothetical protein
MSTQRQSILHQSESESILEKIFGAKDRQLMEWVKAFNKSPTTTSAPSSVSGLLGRAFLTTDEYARLIPLWEEKGYQVWEISPKLKDLEWRRKFFTKLKTETARFIGLIWQHFGRPSTDERGDLEYLLEESRGDPVLFLNFCGVPCQQIIATIETDHDRAQRLNDFEQKRVKGLDVAISNLESAARSVQRYRNIVSATGLYPELSNEILQLSSILKELRRGRGRAPASFWASLACGLYSTCEYNIRDRIEKPEAFFSECYWQEIPRERVLILGYSAILPAMTAILLAAFPQRFNAQKNPLRNVRNLIEAKLSKEERLALRLL